MRGDDFGANCLSEPCDFAVLQRCLSGVVTRPLFVLTTTRHFAAPHEAVCRKLSPKQPHDDSLHRFSLSLKQWRAHPVWFVLYGAPDSFSNLPFRGILIAFVDGQLLYSDSSVLHSLAADPMAV